MRLTVLVGDPGAAPFVAAVHTHRPETLAVLVGTGDDITHLGLRVCGTTEATLGALAGRRPSVGRAVEGELRRLGGDAWLPLADEELAAHLVRTDRLARGRTPSEVTAELAAGLGLPDAVSVRPVSDVPVETHVVIAVDDPERPEAALHVREWRERLGGSPLPSRVVAAGLDRAVPAPGVLESIRGADLVVVAPGDPVLALGPMLGVQGLRDALRGTSAPVVVVDPFAIADDVPGLGIAGLPTDGPGAARVYRDIADGWVTTGPVDGYPSDLRVRPSGPGPDALAAAAIELGGSLRR